MLSYQEFNISDFGFIKQYIEINIFYLRQIVMPN